MELKGGYKMTPVFYRGSAPAINDLLAGTIDMVPDYLLANKGNIDAGKIKMIAVADTKRLKEYPNVPTMEETMPGVTSITWMAVSAPPGTPTAITQKISDSIGKGFKQPDMHARILKLEAEPLGSTPERDAQDDQGERGHLGSGGEGRAYLRSIELHHSCGVAIIGRLSAARVAHVLQPAVDEGLKVRLQHRHRLLDELVAAAADVGRDDDVRHPPQRIVGRQRHVGKDIEAGAGDLAGLQVLDQRRLVEHAAAREIDQERRGLHRRHARRGR